ncbi:putative RNA polymerase sigma factor FecI [Mycolicibacterium aubagnense]
MSVLNLWLGDLFRLHHDDFVRYASRLVGGRDNGEEVVQNAYVRVAGRASAATVIDHPKAYLITATRNAAVDYIVRQQAEWSRRVDIEDIAGTGVGEDPTITLDHRHRIARLAVLLNELPAACREAFIMNKVEGRTHREIAKHLGVSISMVEKHIIRALFHCRDLMRAAREI